MAVTQQIPTQADKRRNMILYDQHRPPKNWYQLESLKGLYGLEPPLLGRPWFASIEKASGYPTGLVQPLFAVPHPELVPPQKWLRFPERQPGRILILYEQWEAERDAALMAWEQERIRSGQLIHGTTFSPDAPPSIQLVTMIGPKPQSPVPVRALIEGNSWCLGFSTIRPPEADQLWPDETKLRRPAVFTETEPFTDPGAEELAGQPADGVSLAALLEAVMAECPGHLKGGARQAWAMKRLQEMAATQEA